MSFHKDIVFIDDEEHLRNAVAQTFELADLSIQCFADAEDALSHISRDFSGILVTDIRMPGIDGLEVLKRALEIDYELPVLLVTGHGDVQMAVDAMQRGAYDFIEKPFAPDHLVEVARRALDKRRLTIENRRLRADVINRDAIELRLAGRTKVMTELRELVRHVAASQTDILVIGETGSGKEVIARAVHDLSDRKEKPFVAINCAAIPSDQMDSELFGHEIGAYPGAIKGRFGKLEYARGGTVFLDSLESAPSDLQAKLLRVLEERSVTRVGSNEPIELDLRIIAASKIDLAQLADAGTFLEELYHRLNTITLQAPALASRKEDIPGLFTQLANEAARKYRVEFAEISPQVISTLMSRDWPGNVRELKNAADRFILGFDISSDSHASNKEISNLPLSDRVANFEKETISAELAAHDGVLSDTYHALGISRKSLYEKMQRYGLDKNDYR